MKNYYSLKRVYIYLLFLPFLLLGYTFQQQNSSFTIPTPIDSLEFYRNTEITKEEIYYHIKYLASDELEGRQAGTKGDILARDYISSEFLKYRLEPAGDSSYIQLFPIESIIQAGNNNNLIIKQNSKDKRFILEQDFYPYRLSGNVKAEGDLVFLGYGIKSIKYNDYLTKDGKEIDVKNKVIVFFDDVPESKKVIFKGDYKSGNIKRKVSEAISAGASGIIVIYNKTDKKGNPIFPELVKPSGDENYFSIPVLYASIKSFEQIFKNVNLDIYNIQNRIIESQTPNSFSFENTIASMESEVKLSSINTSNIIGFVRGSDSILNKEVILVGAHYDHIGMGFNIWSYNYSGKEIHNGADDNASGTTGVLELAQKVSVNKNNFKRSFLFICFGAEEMGLLGSAYFTKSRLFNKYNIVAMINLDMIGRLKDNSLVINGTGTSSLWVELLDYTNKKYNFKTTYIPGGIGGSDHTSFTLKKIPTLFFFTGIHDDYHRPTDDYWKINIAGEERILNFVYDVITYIANTNEKITFSEVSYQQEKNKEEKVKLEVYLGTIPDFSYDGKGFKLLGVKKDSPADKAGLTAEDVIIELGNKEIKDIYDYTNALAEHKPGDEVKIVIVREGKELIIKAVLGTK